MFAFQQWQDHLHAHQDLLKGAESRPWQLFQALFPTPYHYQVLLGFLTPSERNAKLRPVYQQLKTLLTDQLTGIPITLHEPDNLSSGLLMIAYEGEPWIELNLIQHELYRYAPEALLELLEIQAEVESAEVDYQDKLTALKTTKYPWMIEDDRPWASRLKISFSKKEKRRYFQALEQEQLNLTQVQRQIKQDQVKLEVDYKLYFSLQAFWLERLSQLCQYTLAERVEVDKVDSQESVIPPQSLPTDSLQTFSPEAEAEAEAAKALAALKARVVPKPTLDEAENLTFSLPMPSRSQPESMPPKDLPELPDLQPLKRRPLPTLDKDTRE